MLKNKCNWCTNKATCVLCTFRENYLYCKICADLASNKGTNFLKLNWIKS